jgi:uridine phosphorylase
MPARLRPTAPIAAAAVLVGDPGRALMLAQALLEEPKMSNHARGLWGYTGRTPAGGELSIQATGMGGPSAALVLADLAGLGVRRAVRVGTCVAIESEPKPGDLLTIFEAHAWSGGGAGAAVLPDAGLTAQLQRELGQATHPAVVASLDVLHRNESAEPAPYDGRVDAADMQTAALFSTAATLGLAIAAVLIVAESAAGDHADDERIETAAKFGGAAAAASLEVNPQPKVES